MQLVDKHDKTTSSSDHWRTKVSPIPPFLQHADKDDLFPTVEQDKDSPIMKGILYAILTATIGVLVGYVVSYLMRAPQASTAQALEELVSSVKTQSNSILAAGKTASAQATGKDAGKDGGKAAAPAGGSASATAATPAQKSPAVAPAGPPPAPAMPAPPQAMPASPAAPAPASPAASPAPAAAPASPAPATAAAPAPAKKPIPQGPVFLKGTNPYGPPPLVEQDIFDSSTTLRVEYDPSAVAPPPAYEPQDVKAPTFQQLVDPTPHHNFQIQLGSFNSRLNATQFANRLQEKGYQVNIYEGPSGHSGAWYFVRLDKAFDHLTALETAKNIHATEKFLPMVVQPTDTEKKLR